MKKVEHETNNKIVTARVMKQKRLESTVVHRAGGLTRRPMRIFATKTPRHQDTKEFSFVSLRVSSWLNIKISSFLRVLAANFKAVDLASAAFLVIGIGMIFSGCAHYREVDAGIFSAKGLNYSHTVPETVKLSDYKVIQIHVTSPIKKSDAFCCQLQDKITGMLKEKRLFEKVLKEGETVEFPADLYLDSEIVALDKVTALDRMFFDDFVGKAKMVVINRLKDVKTGQELGTFTTGGQSASGGLASMFAAGTTKQALKYTAQQIVEFIQTHM